MNNTLSLLLTQYLPLLVLVIFIDLILRSIALWKAARHNQLYWFIALTVINTAGILPVIYLIIFHHRKKKK